MSVRALSVLPAIPATRREDCNGQQGLEDEVIALFEQFRTPLLRYALSFGLTIPDAEEVIQEVFLSLFEHLQRNKPRHNLRSWLFRVAHNLGLKQRYRVRRELNVLDAKAIENFDTDPAPNPEDQMVNRQIQQRIRTLVQALPEQDRRCISLRAEGLRYREIAEVLDMSLGAVSLSLTRSLARIEKVTRK